jgi:hypothetical protein
MPYMTDDSDSHPPSDVCLLLRAHAEQHRLARDLLPVLRELERDPPQEDQLAAALAYLEVLWIESCQRATETDEARAELDAAGPSADRGLHCKARCYHAAVRRLRAALANRVARLVAVPRDVLAHRQVRC